MKQRCKGLEVGGIYPSNQCGDFRVLEILNSKSVKIEFLNTGYTKQVAAGNLREGKAVDPLQKLTVGVGVLGGTKHKPTQNGKHTAAYKTWAAMIKRCYDPKHKGYKFYGARGVSVCSEWHNFQEFADWFEENSVEGYHLDKDIITHGSRLYSPETCCFVPVAINILLVKPKRNKNGWATGTRKREDCRCWSARLKDENKKEKYLGMFDSMHQAFLAYKEAKEERIKSVAEKEYSSGNITKKVYQSLMNWEVYPY